MTETEKKAETEKKTKNHPMYRVLIHNDDVTDGMFVITVLLEVFKKEWGEAERITNEAHRKGLALVAVMPLELAELRVDQAHSKARAKKFPLKLTYEPE